MARRIDSRLILTGQLVAETPISVGGLGGNADVDLALAVDGQGRFYVPGGSLAGPMRAWLCARVQEKTKVEELWGYQKKKKNAKGEDEDKGQASFVIVEDGLVSGANGSEVRDGVGIDRRTGAAADKAKYNRAILPRGSSIDFKMTVELTQSTQQENESLLAELWEALQKGEIRVGASKTRGLGCVSLKNGKAFKQAFNTRAGLLDVLRNAQSNFDLKTTEGSRPEFYKQPRLSFEIDWQPVGPLMVKAEADGLAVDMLPLVSAVDGKLAFVLPGSSIKGAFRSQAERIVRTVRPELQPELPVKFLNQVEVTLIEELFGAAGKTTNKNGKKDNESWPESSEPVAGLSALSIDDCYAQSESRMTPKQWTAVESATDEESLRAALDQKDNDQKTPLKDMQQAFHVAIDRWLGSAADGFLYTVLEPHGIRWEPIHLTLDLARLPNDKREAAIACTLLVLRDFVAGRLPLGFGVNRGMGAVEVTGIKVTPHDLDDDLKKLKLTVAKRQLKITDDSLRQKLTEAWQSDKWHKANSDQPNIESAATEQEAE